MFKLSAAIRSHFVVVTYIEAKGPTSRSPRQTFAPIMESHGIPWRSPSVAVPKPWAALRASRPVEIEVMNASLCEHHLPAWTSPLLPDSILASLRCTAPALCSPLRRMGR